MNYHATSFQTFDSIAVVFVSLSLSLSLPICLSLLSHFFTTWSKNTFLSEGAVPSAIWRSRINNGGRKLHFMCSQVWAAAPCFMHVSKLYGYRCKKTWMVINWQKAPALFLLTVIFFFFKYNSFWWGEVGWEHSKGMEDSCCCHGFRRWPLSLCS